MADAQPVIKSTVTGWVRFTLALFIATALAIFIFVWDGKYINGFNLPEFLGPFIFFPLLSLVLGYGINCLIQYLSCKQVEWLVQIQRAAIIPLPQIIIWGLLSYFTSMRWPIEGLVQNWNPDEKKALSSGFYGFWIGLYTQSIMNGFAQLCPTV
uniref:Uncharacterized protein n=1 Tax=viral metagenome TaxID=1070528 RepID=A0A6C0AP85_9ZZZZ